MYGVRGVALKWFTSYLSKRKQFFRFEGKDSSFRNINIGVPQGSILGPLLFLVYINDMHQSSSLLNFILFADDTTVYIQDPDHEKAVETLSFEFQKVYTWLAANKLSLNVIKTKCMIFISVKRTPQDYTNTIDDTVTVQNFLGS